MSWSAELWDQFETVSISTAKSVDFIEKLGHFVKDLSLLENDYAARLRKICKRHELKKDDDKEFSYCKAYRQAQKEVCDLAGQHEVIAENLSTQIVKEIAIITKDLRDERKRHLNEGVKCQNLLVASLAQLDRSLHLFKKAFKESAKANELYEKSDKDLSLSRAELEKIKQSRLAKERACDAHKTDYAKQLQTTNQIQSQHYFRDLPMVFDKLQEMESRKIDYLRKFMRQMGVIELDVAPIISKCLNGVIEAADTIDASTDAQLVIDRYKSGMQPPDDIPFEDLSARASNCETESTQSKGSSLVYSHSLKSDSLRHTFTARGLKKRTRLLGIFGSNKNDFSELPPNQKRKQIQTKIDQLNSQISQAHGVKDGLIIMRQAYEENGAFGDPKTIENQLRENEATIERLQSELSKHLVLLDEMDVAKPDKINSGLENESNKSPSINNSNHHRSSIGPESELSRTNSDNSLRPDSNNHEATKSSATNNTSNSFNDSISDNVSNNAANTATDTVDGANNGSKDGTTNNHAAAQEYNSDGYETPSDLPIQAFARALYPFKAEPAGSISMKESELFDVIEYDQGDGWTRVRRKVFKPEDEDFIGFVPTSYISIDTNSYP